MKVDTDITASTTACPVGLAVILEIISVETFITDIIVSIGINEYMIMHYVIVTFSYKC